MTDLHLTREAAYKAISKEEILKALTKFTRKSTLMFAHFGGSVAYGTYLSNSSDIDVIAFYDGLERIVHVPMDGIDVFAYPKRCVDLKALYSDWVGSYNKSFMDVKLSLPDSLIYINETYRAEYEQYASAPFESILKEYLFQFIDFFSFRLDKETRPSKKFYHIVRVLGQLENYKKTGKYTLDLTTSRRSEMMDYKKNYANPTKKEEYIKKANEYLKKIKEEFYDELS